MLHKRKFSLFILLLFAACTVLIFLLARDNSPQALVQNGKLDLSQWDGESILFLSGDWDFFWNRFLDENDFSRNPSPDIEAKVPSVWNEFKVDGKQIGGMGYATYRLHVTGAKAGSPLALRVLPFSTAYVLYIDHEPIASSGTISTSAAGFVPRYEVQTVTFTPERSEFDIILHISNFVYARGGAWYTIYFGSPEKINSLSQMIFGRDFFLIGCLLIISAYCLFLFYLRKDKGYLLFFALCMIFLCRTVINGNYPIMVLYPSIKFRTIIWMDYITLYWLPGLCLWLFHNLYPKSISRVLIKILLIYAVVITAVTLIVPLRIFTNFIYMAELVSAAIGLYGVVKMILLTARREPEAFYMLAGNTALTFCVIHDVLCENTLIRTGYVEYSPVGFLIMALFLQCMFGARYDRSIKANEKMLRELSEAEEREQKLELQFLKSQIRPHFINNALNAIISLSRTDTNKARKLLVEFSKYLWNCYGVKNLDDMVPIENELSFVRSYVALEQARFPDTLHVAYDIDSGFLMVPPLSLQPLVENAILHGVRGKSGDGYVLIYAKNCGDSVKVGVSDNGVGMAPELLASVLSNEHQGTGIGIYNINQRMKKLYHTGLYLENRPEGGINAYIIVPKEGEPCCGLY